MVNALSDIFFGPGKEIRLKGSPDGNTWASIVDTENYTGRTKFYDELAKLIGDSRFANLAGKLTLRATSENLKSLARKDFGAFAALYSLSPFVLGVKNNGQTLETLVGPAWDDIYTAWSADKRDIAAGKMSQTPRISNEWMDDRASMLERKSWFNFYNANPQNLVAGSSAISTRFMFDNMYFEDVATDYKIAPFGLIPTSLLPITRRYFFGDSNSTQGKTFIGGSAQDHLYGSGGNDTLDGQGGNDYLEGGAGIDALMGGAGNDILRGGTADDILNGGADLDTYVINTGDGSDTIIDSGPSRLKRNGKLFTGLFERNPGTGTYRFVGKSDDDGKDVIIQINSPASFDLGNGDSVTFQNLTTRDLVNQSIAGIHLIDASTDPVTTRDIIGDLEPADPPQSDDLGNPVVTATAARGRADTLYGSDGNDNIISGGGDDIIIANGGDDKIDAGSGRDRIVGGAGNDVIIGGADTDIISGGEGNDRIYAVASVTTADFINGNLQDGQAGTPDDHDWIEGGAGDDVIFGSASADGLAGGGGDDLFIGGAGADNIFGDLDAVPTTFDWGYTDIPPSPGNPFGSRQFEVVGINDPADSGTDSIYGGAGDDYIRAGFGDDTVFGEGENDNIGGEAGNDTILGGDGIDFIFGDAPYIDASFHGDDYLDGGAGNDSLVGEGGADTIYGDDGNDLINGDDAVSILGAEFNGDDNLDGGAGDDNIVGAGGADTIFGGEGDDLLEGDAPDTPVAFQGADSIDGGDGNDFLKGDGGDDMLAGDAGNDQLEGDDGNDTLNGGDGADFLEGDAGNDMLDGGNGNDQLSGGDGNDIEAGGAGEDVVLGDAGDDQIDGGDGNDQISGGDGNDIEAGGAGDDVIVGDAGDDQLEGDDGNDQISGGDGNDLIAGSDGNDVLVGGNGNDTLEGDGGSDMLEGGAGKDAYEFNLGGGADTINDASTGADASSLNFGDSITASDLSLGIGSLMINVGTNGDSVHIQNFDIRDPYSSPTFDSFNFADGTSLNWTQLLALGFTIDGTNGDDNLWGADGPDTIDAKAGNDFIQARDGDDAILGGTGDDVIWAQGGADTIDGGAGDDTMYGGRGDDAYVIDDTQGRDLIIDYDPAPGNVDTLKLGYNPSQFSTGFNITRDSSNIYFGAPGNQPTLTLGNQVNANYRIESIGFADGTRWDVATLFANSRAVPSLVSTLSGTTGDDILTGQSANEALIGGAGNDTLTGGGGSDELQGGAGSDTYVFNSFSGQGFIFDFDDGAGGVDTIQFGAGILAADTIVTRDNFNLHLRNNSLAVTISNWFTGPEYRIEQVKFNDGTTWDESTLLARATVVATGDASYFGTDGNDTLKGGDGAADLIYGLEGDDTITLTTGRDLGNGMVQADVVDGGLGNDTYVATGGVIANVVKDHDPNPGNVDTLLLGPTPSFLSDGSDFQTDADGRIGIVGPLSVVPYFDVSGTGPAEPSYVFNPQPIRYDRIRSAQALTLPNTIDESNTTDLIEQIQFAGAPGHGALTLSPSALLNITFNLEASHNGSDARDRSVGGSGDDILNGGTRNDTIFGGGGNDVIHGGDGQDDLYGGHGDDEIYGDENGGDALYGNEGNDIISGGSSSDLIYGGDGADELRGNHGDDTLNGGDGNDTYWFNAGDGVDTIDDISDTAAPNVVQFGAGITPAQIQLVGELQAWDIKIGGNGDRIRFSNYDQYDAYGKSSVGLLRFDDGEELTYEQFVDRGAYIFGISLTDNILAGTRGADHIFGSVGMDQLYGFAGNDELDGGAGDDYLAGGEGSDIYLFGRNAGSDVVEEIDAAADDTDSIQMADGVLPGDVIVGRDSRNLFLQIRNTPDKIVIRDWFVRPDARIEQVKFADGTIWSAASLEAMAAAGIFNSIVGTGGDDFLTGTPNADLMQGEGSADFLFGRGLHDKLLGGTGTDYLAGGGGDDLLDGGAGDDHLRGSAGADTYRWGRGSGNDKILESDPLSAFETDTIEFGPGISPADLAFTYDNDNLYITITDTGEQLTVQNLFQQGAQIEQYKFADADATIRDQYYIVNVATYSPAPFNYFSASPGDDFIVGTEGNDYIQTYDGNDQIQGNAGNDYIEGWAGNDVLDGGDGDDVLVGGEGDDLLRGGAGNDTYRMGFNGGLDEISETDSTPGNVDALELVDFISPLSTSLLRTGANLVLNYLGGRVIVDDWYADVSHQVEELRFSDGTIWDLDYLLNGSDGGINGGGGGSINPTYGSDVLYGTDGDDTIDALDGNDQVYGNAGNDTITGSTGSDALHGGSGDDFLYDSFGSDQLDGDAGSDTYLYGKGFSYDSINNFDPNPADMDTLQLTGLVPGEVTFLRYFTDLWVRVDSTSEFLTIRNWFANDNFKLDRFTFGDGTVLDSNAVEQKLIIRAPSGTFGDTILLGTPHADVISGDNGNDNIAGDAGNDVLTGGTGADKLAGDAGDDGLNGGADDDNLYGGDGNDTLVGGAGNDALLGGAGDDAYLINVGDGPVDTLVETGEVDGQRFGTNRIRFGPGITPDRLSIKPGYFDEFRQVYDSYFGGPIDPRDIVIGYNNSGGRPNRGEFSGQFLDIFTADMERVVIKDGLDERIQYYEFDNGTVWSPQQLMDYLALAQDGAGGNDVLTGHYGTDVIHGLAGNDTIIGMEGSDDLYGGVGSDMLAGGAGFDYLFGGDGIDFLNGGSDGDYLFGGAGNDALDGGTENDTLYAGDGNDTAFGGTGNDVVYGDDSYADSVPPYSSTLAGNDELHGGDGNDTLYGMEGSDQLFGDAGNDILFGGLGSDYLAGGEGDDQLLDDGFNLVNYQDPNAAALRAGSDILEGGAGNDILSSAGGNDFLDGGTGVDRMSGGADDDIYVIDDFGDAVIEGLGQGIDLVLSSVTYALSANVDNLTLTGAAPINGSGNNLNNIIIGNSAANVLTGLSGNDRIDGGGGADTMIGGTGNDTYVVDDSSDIVAENAGEGTDTVESSITYTLGATLENLTLTGSATIDGTGNSLDNVFRGNSANNVFTGGDGSDTYFFGRGSGQDTIFDTATIAGSTDTIQLEPGVLPGDVNVFRIDNDLQLAIRFTQERSTAKDWFTGTVFQIEQVRFDNGIIWNIGTLQSLAGTAPVNHAPALNVPLADQSTIENSAFSLALPPNTFGDSDSGDSLLLGATLSDGSVLPGWLHFNAVSGVFSGTPHQVDVGTINVKISATDVSGVSAFDNFNLTVQDVNVSPNLVNPIADQGTFEDVQFSFQIAANTFSDASGDALNYSAAQADGSALPAWLMFDAVNRVFSGTPANADVGNVSVKLTATDSGGLSVSDTFGLTVVNVNDAPILVQAIDDQAATEDAAFTFVVPATVFTDPDAGDTLTFAATRGDGTALPSWLAFDSATRTFSGTPLNADVGGLSLKIAATDAAGASAFDTFDVSVANTNDAPALANAIADQSAAEDAAFSFTVPSNTFADVDVGDSLTYTATRADGSALPGWLSFDAVSRSFSGTPVNDDVGTLSVKVVATDTGNASAFDTFDVAVINTNDAPIANPDAASVLENAITGNLVSALLANDTDVDIGDTRTISAVNTTGTTGVVAFDAGTQTLTYAANGATLDALRAGVASTDTFSYTVTDGSGATSTATVTMTVTGVNDAPALANPIADQVATQNTAFSFTAPLNTFSDVDIGDMPAYTATLSNGAALPGWLTFNAVNRTFSGTPGARDSGVFAIKLNATDTGSLSASGIFNITVGTAGGVNLIGTPNPDVLNGGLGNDTINGLGSADLLNGNGGDDSFIYFADGVWTSGFVALNVGSPGNAGTGKTAGIAGKNRALDVFNGGTGVDVIQGTSGNDTLFLDDSYSAFPGGTRVPRISGIERIEGGDGNDVIDLTSDVYAYGNVILDGGDGNDVLWASSGDDVLLGGAGNDDIFGGAGQDYLMGGGGNDTLNGDRGNDLLEGDDGNDALTDSYGNNLLYAKDGNDSLTGGAGNDLFIGGKGNDTITPGAGADVIVFNRGDDHDTVAASTGHDNTVSLGGGIRYGDLFLGKQGNSLVLQTGASDDITFKDWYSNTANHSVFNLQVVAEAMSDSAPGGGDPLRDNKIERFNFNQIVQKFDQARAASSSNANHWAVMNTLLDAHLAGSDTEAISGDLAYRYGLNGNLSGIAANAAQNGLVSPQFGAAPQTLQPLAGLQDGLVKLS